MEQPPNTPSHYWSLELQQLFDLLQSNPKGLTDSSVLERKRHYGANLFTEKKSQGPLIIFLTQFLSPLIGILLFAAGMTWYLGETIETVVILGAVFLNVLLAFFQEYKAEHTMDMLRSYLKNKARVLRNGELIEINAEDLVPGDIISITYGSRIPADARIIQSDMLRSDEAILTGESLPVLKEPGVITQDTLADRTNTVFCGTYVTQGMGLALVVTTGNATEIGKIATSVAQTKRVKTPVQNAVQQISWYVFGIVLIIVGLIFVLGITRGENIFDMLVLSAAVAVGAVPEALPIALTVILSVGIVTISQRGGLMRKLAAAETLGSTTLIMTDKTGTLTKGELTLEGIYTTHELLNPTLPVPQEQASLLPEHYQTFLIRASYNISATVEKPTPDPVTWIYSGGAFDVVILKNIHAYGITSELYESRFVLPFNSTNKFSVSTDGTTHTVLGAPDILIHQSSLTDHEKQHLLDRVMELSTQGKRLIALGTKPHTENPNDISGVTILGLFAFSDPLRLEAKEALADIQSKGVRVIIITGDMIGTAKHIAQQLGINVSDHEILSGEQLRGMDDSTLQQLIPHIKLFVRVTPEDKLRVGNLYRHLGEVVAMTGDGVNDAPALKSMDIGISLGSGSDVAKSAADMILLDNNFKTITDTINEGYTIRANIQKSFVYLMSNSLDSVFVIAGSLIAGLALPLSALQIIWINMVTGTLPALAFAYDQHYPSRRDYRQEIFNFRTKFLALGIGTMSSLALFGLYIILLATISDVIVVRSIFFVCFGTYVLSISYSFKNMSQSILTYNPLNNLRLNGANLVGLLLIIMTITVPFFQKLFMVTWIPLKFIWIIIVWNIFNIILVEFAKWSISLVANRASKKHL